MSISRQNLSVVIVSFISEEVIHNCIESIPTDINILVVDNSGNKEFKLSIEEKYNNVKCILSSQNLGMGAGNNLGLKNSNTDYALILNPDVILENDTIDQLISDSKKIESFGVIAPIINSDNNMNYKLFEEDKINKKFKILEIINLIYFFYIQKHCKSVNTFNLERINRIFIFFIFVE